MLGAACVTPFEHFKCFQMCKCEVDKSHFEA